MSDQAPFIPSAPDEVPIPPAPWRVFRTPGFIPLIGAQFVSSLGDWTGLLAIIAIAQKLSGSGTGIGLVMVARMLPGFVLAPLGGALLDRWNRKVVMVSCDVGRFALLMVLPFWDNLLGLVVLSFLIEILTLLWGPAKEVFFAQIHAPGRLAASDFTSMNDLQVAIAGAPFPHLVYHFVLTHSNWEHVTLCFGEDFASLQIECDGLGALRAAVDTERDHGEDSLGKRWSASACRG